MSDCLDDNDFAALIEDRMAPASRQRALQHTNDCPDCHATYSMLQKPGAAAEGPAVGALIAGYRIKSEIGSGAMGAVYLAEQENIRQRAAVKVLFPQFSQDPHYIRRFRTEARAASVVQHPGLVTIFNYGQFPDGTAYIMMEYLEGESLKSRLARFRAAGERLPIVDVLRISRQIASGMAAVHKHGIVHRDLKPANVMIVSDSDVEGGERAKVVGRIPEK